MPGPTIGALTNVKASSVVRDWVEISFTVAPGAGQPAFSTGAGGDVWDASQLDVWLIATHNFSGSEFIVAYYNQDYTDGPTARPEVYTASGSPNWHALIPVRDAYALINYTIHAFDRRVGGGETLATSNILTSAAGTPLAGVPLVDPRHPKFLAHADGSPLNIIGNNVANNDAGGIDGVSEKTLRFDEISTQGGTFARVWLQPEEGDFPGEWKAGLTLDESRTNSYLGLGGYNLRAFHRISRYLDLAAARGMDIQFALLNHNMGQLDAGVGKWVNNPYSAANGGPVVAADPYRFFDNATAIASFKKFLRVFMAHFGARPNWILEWGNELGSWGDWPGGVGAGSMYSNGSQSTGLANRTAMQAWVGTMGTFVRTGDGGTFTGDPLRHLRTWSQEYDGGSTFDVVANSAEIDLWQIHRYTMSEYTTEINGSGPSGGGIATTTPVNLVKGFFNRVNKPVIFAEFGLERESSADNNHFPEPGFSIAAGLPGYGTGWSKHTTVSRDHIREGTHARNMPWVMRMLGSAALHWWPGSYLAASGTARPAGDANQGWPIQTVVIPALVAYWAGEDLAAYTPDVAILAPTLTGVLGEAIGNVAQVRAFVRDPLEQFSTTVEPARIAARTTTGAVFSVSGRTAGLWTVEYWNTYAAGGLSSSTTATVSGSGILSLSLPTFTGSIAIKASLTSNGIASAPRAFGTGTAYDALIAKGHARLKVFMG